ncbi:hypothetical protein [Streptomyces atriruber]|uniref:hypothetical protein n=1 Tax=Streptomyces atriruber TaxID=545121 RepID=UPI0006E12F19|nr:hypothetical protein [Streptomyces atriruber]
MPLAQPRRPGRPPEDLYLCSGRDSPVRCADCGGYLSATVHQRGAVYEDGEVRRHYRVLKRPAGGCGRTVADLRALDSVIGDLTVQRLTDPQQVAMIRRIQAERRAAREPYAAEIARHEETRAYFDQRLGSGAITTAQHAAAVGEADAGILAARAALDGLAAAPVPELDEQAMARIAAGWRSATSAQRYRDLRRVWLGFQIFVTPGSSTETEEQVRKRVSRPKRTGAA